MSRTVHIEESVHIAEPTAEVWDAIADYAFDLDGERAPEMTPDPPGPPAVGTKVHEVVRTSGREYVADTVVTDLDPGVSYRFDGAGTIGGLTRRPVGPGDGRARGRCSRTTSSSSRRAGCACSAPSWARWSARG